MTVISLIVQAVELAWLLVLTAAWVAQRKRHDRLLYRVSSLSKTVTKVGRMRHTASQPAVGADITRLAHSLPPPPFPVPPPSTNPITASDSPRGKHAG